MEETKAAAAIKSLLGQETKGEYNDLFHIHFTNFLRTKVYIHGGDPSKENGTKKYTRLRTGGSHPLTHSRSISATLLVDMSPPARARPAVSKIPSASATDTRSSGLGASMALMALDKVSEASD